MVRARENLIKTLTTDQLADLQRSNGLKLIDARPTAAFNGWRLRGESRGGHIPNAVSFPWSWAAGAYDADLVERLALKGLTPDRSITVYGYDDEDATGLADRLLYLGYDDVAVLAGGLPEWAAQPDSELIRLPRNHQLVHPEWLHHVLEGEATDEAPEGPF
ncbi:MAG: rhodanese-like domain-containing protein, partial [bacterium]|nr:rhodanese-like domain-containing protein [bacterium]